MYQQHRQQMERQSKLKKDEELKLEEARRQIHQNNKRSDKMVEQTRRAKLSDIFDVFDADQDGVISATKIDLYTLPTEMLELFSPLICEMEEINTTLNREEFIDASIRLLNVTLSQLTLCRQ